MKGGGVRLRSETIQKHIEKRKTTLLNILYFYQYFGTPKGGWSTRVYEMCRRWVQAGHRVRVITSLYDKSDLQAGGIYTRHRIDGIEVYVINVKLSNKHGFLYRIFTFIWYAVVATVLGIRLSCDVIVASSGPITIGIPALLTKWVKQKPMVFEVRDLWPEGAVAFNILRNPLLVKAAYWFEALCYRESALVVTASPGATANIKERFPEVPVETIPNAADVELFRHRAVPPTDPRYSNGKKHFVYTGTLGLIDDCTQIVAACSALQRRHRDDIEVLMIGDGKERPALEALAKKERLSNIHFLGLMPKESLVGYLRASRASLLTVKPIPFMDNCSPNKMFDAFAAGVPVVQTTQGWIRDLLESKGGGLNVAAGDPEDFADALELLADDDTLHARMSLEAAALADTTFSRDVLSMKMLDALERASAVEGR